MDLKQMVGEMNTARGRAMGVVDAVADRFKDIENGHTALEGQGSFKNKRDWEASKKKTLQTAAGTKDLIRTDVGLMLSRWKSHADKCAAAVNAALQAGVDKENEMRELHEWGKQAAEKIRKYGLDTEPPNVCNPDGLKAFRDMYLAIKSDVDADQKSLQEFNSSLVAWITWVTNKEKTIKALKFPG